MDTQDFIFNIIVFIITALFLSLNIWLITERWKDLQSLYSLNKIKFKNFENYKKIKCPKQQNMTDKK